MAKKRKPFSHFFSKIKLNIINKKIAKTHRVKKLWVSSFICGNLILGQLQNDQLQNDKLQNDLNSLLNTEKQIENGKSNISDNSFNNLENSEKIVQTGNGITLKLEQKKILVTEENINLVLLAKNDNVLPGVEGFSNSNYPRRRHPLGPPRIKTGKINADLPQQMRKLNDAHAPVRSFRRIDTHLDGKRSRADRCVSKFNLEEEYSSLIENLEKKILKLTVIYEDSGICVLRMV